MGLKDLPYWLKGLIIGLLVGLGWVLLAIIVDGFKFLTAKIAIGLPIISMIVFCITFIVGGLLSKLNWPYFARGAGIGASFYIITVIVFWISETLSCGGEGMCGLVTAWMIYILWITIPLGAIIGWIVGKIKSKKSVSE